MGPIGVFDSGYGGLTVLNDIRKRLPQYDYLYLGDNARAPYGTRSFDVVYAYTLQAVEELFNRGCQLVILACNTASAKALRTIQQNDLPRIAPDKRVLGVIRPSAERIGELSSTGHIGILATEGTVRSNSYVLELEKFAPHIHVNQHACPMWVPLIENDMHNSIPGKMFLKQDFDQLIEQDDLIDTVLLGCTHYPIVKSYLEEISGRGIQIIAQGEIVAEKLEDYLKRHPEIEQQCSKAGKVHFLTSENVQTFDANAMKFTGLNVCSEHVNLGLKGA
jgi:glutamate racemase